MRKKRPVFGVYVVNFLSDLSIQGDTCFGGNEPCCSIEMSLFNSKCPCITLVMTLSNILHIIEVMDTGLQFDQFPSAFFVKRYYVRLLSLIRNAFRETLLENNKQRSRQRSLSSIQYHRTSLVHTTSFFIFQIINFSIKSNVNIAFLSPLQLVEEVSEVRETIINSFFFHKNLLENKY